MELAIVPQEYTYFCFVFRLFLTRSLFYNNTIKMYMIVLVTAVSGFGIDLNF